MVSDFTNFNLNDVVTPIDVTKLRHLLVHTGYDSRKTQDLIKGFSEGFDMGYRGPIHRQDTSRNLPFRVGTSLDMWEKIMKEVRCGRYAGPYQSIPYQNYMQSPIGLVAKSGGKTRLIFHLSYDFGPEVHQKSFNYHTPDHLCSVKYRDLDFVIMTCLGLLKSSISEHFPVIYFSKTDLLSAFRILPALPSQRKYMCMYAHHPKTH